MKLYSELRGLMVANGYTQRQLARVVGIPYGTLCKRMTGKLQFDMDEAYRTLDLFGVPHTRLHEIFPHQGRK